MIKIERLQKFMASAGVASRRKCEDIILQGKVKVNGQVVTEMGFKVTAADTIEVDKKIINKPEGHRYYLLNKPIGYITTAADPQGRQTVMELVPQEHRVFPVGRLDIMTSGLLILTDHGDLAYKLTHPKFMIDKEYHVRVNGTVTEEQIKDLRAGIMLDDGMTSEAQVEIISIQAGDTSLTLTIHEGRNRQVRRMMEAIGRNVVSLTRVRYGDLTLEGVKLGKYRTLTKDEVQRLINI